MRGKSSSRVEGMEVVERSSKSKEEPHLSGAYIRSLVKHLSSSRPKDQTMNNPKSPNSTLEDHLDEPQTLPSPPPPPPPQHRKQVRRRLHTSRPYQERLLNMAEARREIVTALRLHRATMKQANHEQQQQYHQHPSWVSPNPNPKPNIHQPIHPTLIFGRNFSSFTYPTLATLPNMYDNLTLPNHPLGLNLDFQGFDNINAIQPISPHSSSSSSFSYSLPPMCGTQTVALGEHGANIMDLGDAKLHVAMGEEEMAEIRSIGEQHDIEWNDTVNLVTSAWWSKFLETVEGNGFHAYDEAIGMPDGLKDGTGGGDAKASQHLLQRFDDQYMLDDSFPCLDTGESEWMNGEWQS